MDLLIALQTHSLSNNQDSIDNFKRYGCNDKSEITKRCVRSLVKSLNYAKNNCIGWSFRLHVFDDHSDSGTVESIKETLKDALFETSFVSLESKGLIKSLEACYKDLRDNGSFLVMQAQDDYLFDEMCFYQCISTWLKFSPKFNKPLSLFPFDDPYRYWDHNITPVRIVHGPDRHWRQVYQTPCTFITHHSVMVDNWELFEEFTEGDSLDPGIEDRTVNKLWQDREYIVMSPIPSLALHFQTDSEKDPYIDWMAWWDKHSDNSISDKVNKKLSDNNSKKILNIGCGTVPLKEQSNYFNEWIEIRADTVENKTTDLTTSLLTLEGIPSQSMDCVWASHVIEHCYWHELPSVFNNILRVLKDDGFAIVRVPDLGSIANLIPSNLLDTLYEAGDISVTPLDMIYGSRLHIQHQGKQMAHKIGFTKSSLEQMLNALNIKSMIKNGNHELIAFIFKDEPPLDAILTQDIAF